MAEKYVITDVPRVSKIKATTPIRKWSPAPERVFYFIDIDFENGDSVKLMESDFTKLMKYNVEKRYFYELTRTTTIDDEGKEKTVASFKYIEELISDQLKARLGRVEQTFEYIKQAAQIASISMAGMPWSEGEFKDRYKVIFDTMKTTLHHEDYGEFEGDDLDAFMKKNAAEFNL